MANPPTESESFRPKRDLWVSAWVAFTAFTVPLFASLYLVTVPSGQWVPFASAHAVLIMMFALAAQRLRGAGITLAPDGIREREYFSRTVFTPAAAIDSVIVIRLRDSNSDSVSQQVFVVNADGRTRLRMRGPVWQPHDLARVVEYYAVPVRVVDPAMTWTEMRRSPFRQNLARWERHPALTTTALVLLFAIVTTPILLVLVPMIHS